ncbi:hypothetical protein VDG1235_1053 [Verrucomicrobiia bacterium DG1235]|nr:hypothetical protein VDG1235_1053 [Verrucomicrobiae bacterium DG1235]
MIILKSLVLAFLFPIAAFASNPDFSGRWRLDKERSSALDGWTAMDLVISQDGSKIEIAHDMRWRSSRVLESNVFDTEGPVEIENYFRVDQRHMAVYAPKQSVTPVSANWIDEGSTLRVEAEVPVEVSQGTATIRIYSEYRVGEGGETLTLIELHSTRNNPLVYRFRKLASDDTSRP